MIFSFAPSPALAPFVERDVVYDFPAAMRNGAPAALTVFPDASSFACFIYGDPLQATHKNHQAHNTRSGICGLQTYRVDMQGAGNMGGVSVRFTPWGASNFVPEDVGVLVDVRVAFRDLYPAGEIESVEDELSVLPDAQAQARRVDTFLLAHLQARYPDPVVRAAVGMLVQSCGATPMRTLARHFEMSERSLERRFLRAMGVGPKKFARVVRLQGALAGHGRTGSWKDTAAAMGYFDQSHLIRDCQSMLGMSPEVLVLTPPERGRPGLSGGGAGVTVAGQAVFVGNFTRSLSVFSNTGPTRTPKVTTKLRKHTMSSPRCPVAHGLPTLSDPLRDADFLHQMDGLLPWHAMADTAAHSLAQASARPQAGVQHAAGALLRIHCVQSWFGLSDQAMADMLLCVPLYRRFTQLEGVLRPLPDAVDIRRFRYRVNRTALGTALLRQVQRLAPRHPQLAGVQTAPDAALIVWAASQEAGWPITSRT